MEKDTVNIIIGDSISYGLGDNKFFGWHNRIRKINQKTQKQFYFNLGIPGEGSCEILKRCEIEIKNRFNSTDVFNVIYEFGIKDALKLKSNTEHLKVFKSNVIKIINKTKKYTNKIFFIGLLDVDIKKRKEYSKEEIQRINDMLKKICNQKKVIFIDVEGLLKTTDLYDGLHPNEKGYKKLSKIIFEKSIDIL